MRKTKGITCQPQKEEHAVSEMRMRRAGWRERRALEHLACKE
jgi:hypothetical protein